MSERDPKTKNVVNLNFNDDISDNGLTVVNMSATTSIYSQCSENSRNCVHLYAPEVTHAFDTTHTSTTDGTQTKPMTEIFIKNFQDEDAEFPTTNSPPTTHDSLETTILAQTPRTQTKSAFRHPATKNYAATDIVKSKTTCFSIPHQFSNSMTAAPTSRNPFYFIPISEKTHKLRPTLINSDDYKYPPPSAALHTSPKTWTSRGYLHPIALTDILLHSPLHLKV
jgi:hypothetical protein